jgi:hypothetical protein
MFNPDKHNVGLKEFTLRKIPLTLVLTFFLALVLWSYQELELRDRYHVAQHRTLNHLLDMLSVLWGALVTGSIFYFIVDHLPAMKKEYERQIAIERNLLGIINSYRAIYLAILKDTERDRTMNGNIYSRKSPIENLWSFLTNARRNDQRQTHYLTKTLKAYAVAFISTTEKSLQELLNEGPGTDWKLHDAARDAMRWIGVHNTVDMETEPPIDTMYWLTMIFEPIHKYVIQRVQRSEHCLAQMHELLHRCSYQHVWDIIEEDNRLQRNRGIYEIRLNVDTRPSHPSADH